MNRRGRAFVLAPAVFLATAGALDVMLHAEESAAPAAATYRRLADELEAYLRRHVLAPRYPAALDREHGGFHATFTPDWTKQPDDRRFVVYQTRNTWLPGFVALECPDLRDEYLAYARHGIAYLRDVMWDRLNGGFYTSLRVDGTYDPSLDPMKVVYGQAFGVYALARAYEATRDPAALDLAQKAFRWIEDQYRDDPRPGYFGAVKRDGSRLAFGPDDVQPSGDPVGEPLGYKGMNPHIHLLEAYAELLRVWPDPLLRRRTEDLLALVRDRFFVEPGALYLFLTPDGRGVPGADSFGHDVETAFLMLEAEEDLGQAGDARTERAARMLVDHALVFGWNADTGQFYERGSAFAPAYDRSVEWWVQFEGTNALLLMHERHRAETTRYWDAFLKAWSFARDRLTDLEHGGVYAGLDQEGKLRPEKSGHWIEGYHQGRSLLLMRDRLRRLAAASTPTR